MKRLAILLGMLLVILPLFAGGSQEEVILRVGSESIGPAKMAIFQDNIAEFERTHPQVTVEWDSSSGDDYQFAGLSALLQSDTPPDIYFEWGGNRVRNHYLDGEAMEISDLAGEFQPHFNASAWSGCQYDGGTYMLPLNQEVTIQMWYDRAVFEELGLAPPQTWGEFMDICAAIKQSGRTPIVMGNADAWVAGNFVGLLLYRLAGNEKAEAIMGLEPGYRLDDPDFVKALQIAYDLGAKGYINPDMNTLGYEESFRRLFDGSSVMYPLGSWYPNALGHIGKDFDEINHDYFMVPPLPGGQGDQSSILGLNVGYCVYINTEQKELAYEFLRLMYDKENQRRHSIETEGLVTWKEANNAADPHVAKLIRDVEKAGSIVAPPDTGYNLEMAFALYEAIAKVFENTATAEEALAAAEKKIAHLRK